LISRVKDVVATYKKAPGKHGQKATSDEKYSDFLRRKFTSLVDTPKWADLDNGKNEEDDSDDEFFKVRTIVGILSHFFKQYEITLRTRMRLLKQEKKRASEKGTLKVES